jgi:hypothetical protein
MVHGDTHRGALGSDTIQKKRKVANICANVVRYLVSPLNTYVSGEKITVHGAADRAGFS